MNSLSNQQDDFIADDFIADSTDDFIADDFIADETPPPKPYDNRIEYLRKQGASEEDIAAFEAENAGVEFEGSKQAYKEAPRGLLSGATAGYSELIPGFKPEGFAGEANKVVGSLAPISLAAKAISYPLKAAAAKSPLIRKGLESFAGLLGLSAAGGIYGGLEESAEKTAEKGEFVAPSLESVLEHGATWAAIDAALKAVGWTGRFGKALADKVISSGKPAEKILENIAEKVGTDKVAEKAISILEDKPLETIEREIKLSKPEAPGKTELFAAEDFSTRVEQRSADLRNRKIEQKDFTKLNEGDAAIPKPYLPLEFEVEKIGEETLSEDLNNKLEDISQRATTEKELGENVQQSIEKSVKEHKAKTDADYAIAQEVESTRTPKLKQTADAIVEQIKRIEAGGLNLTPEGYNRAKKQLIDTLTDLGYGVETGENGVIVRAIESKKIPLSQAVEVKKRLNNILNYDLIETSAQDFLKAPAAALRGEIRAGYGAKNSKARKAFERAEKEFGGFAEQKGKKSIRSLRTSEKPESIAGLIRTPSGLADIKSVVSKEQFAQIERELLEHLREQSQDKAASLYRELRPSLTDDARSVAEQIIESKAPKSSPARKVAQRRAIQDKALDDIAKSTITGQRPEVALDLWKTTEGQQLVKQALEGNPNKNEVLKYLQDQSFKDFATSVVDANGTVNFKKIDNLLKDPATAQNIKLVAGEEGYVFLKNLEHLSSQAEKNASYLERTIAKGTAPEREKARKEIDKFGKQRIEQIKAKNTAKTKEEQLFEDNFNKEAKKDRAEAEESRKALGKERFRKAKEKREAFAKEEEAAREAKEKSGLMYKLDNLVNSYGWKGKGVLTALGIWKIGTLEGIGIAAGYEIITRMAKNKSLRDAITKAATAPKDNTSIIRAILAIEEASDDAKNQ